MPGHDIIVIGASAGGIEPLKHLVSALPADLPAALFVVVHFPANATSVLPQILNRVRSLPATHPADGERIEHGCIYVAPPDRHMLLHNSSVRLLLLPKENRHRPAVDPLFRSAGRAYGPRVVGVILSGSLDDGTSGVLSVKAHGGLTVAQDPHEAIYADMPRSAIENGRVDYVLPVGEIAALLVRLCHESISEADMQKFSSDMQEREKPIVREDITAQENGQRIDQTTTMTCPECGGVLPTNKSQGTVPDPAVTSNE